MTDTRPPLTFAHVPSLDGLRGCAVLIVMCVHFSNLFGLRLASVGVDIFFVLSGFLITTLLLVEYETCGRLSFRNFYVRRALRLTPALLIGVALFGAIDLLFRINDPDLVLKSMGVTSLFYVGNWVRALDLWNMVEFGHTWSLAIEEQFYLVWPATLVALLWLFRRNYVAIAIVVGVMTVTLTGNRVLAILDGASREWISSATQFRVDAILAGVVTALVLGRVRPRPSAAYFIAAMIGLAVIIAILTHPHRYPLWQQPFVVLGACALIVHFRVNRDSWLHRAMSMRWLIYTGVISYGLYIYHYPLVYLTVYRFGGALDPHIQQAIGLFVLFPLSFALAALSYRFAEAPALRLKRHFMSVPRAEPLHGETVPETIGAPSLDARPAM